MPSPSAPNTNAVQSQTMRKIEEAHRHLTEPQKDPLYFENDQQAEYKNLSSQFTSQTALTI